MELDEKILKRLDKQEERISAIEKYLKLDAPISQEEIDEEEIKPISPRKVHKKESFSSISFNQVITFLGILGIIIGAVSFFFYAVANQWIGKSLQVAIGIVLGFALFAFAYKLKDKNQNWSNIVFGGAYFIEYLAIGIGVLVYKVLPSIFGLGLCTLFLISSLGLSIKFKSRSIVYFSLVGGYFIPFITNTYLNDLFILSFYLILTLALVFISYKFNWADLRLVSFIFLNSFISNSLYKFILADSKLIPVIFLILVFVLYNIASLIGSLNNNNNDLAILDSMVIGFLPITFLSYLYSILDINIKFFGLIVMILSLVYLIEIFYFKKKDYKLNLSLIYTLLTTGFITLNLGLIFILNSINLDFFMVLFSVEWLLFAKLSKIVQENNLYKFFSYIFLFLVIIWYLFIVRFDAGIFHGTFFMILFGLIVYGFYNLYKDKIDYKFNGASLAIAGFVFIFSFVKYLAFFIYSNPIREIILSILWLSYCLIMFSKIPNKEGKSLIGVLFAITLLKIAFIDLLYLKGAFRILGFIIFGILLLVGGYFIKNEKSK